MAGSRWFEYPANPSSDCCWYCSCCFEWNCKPGGVVRELFFTACLQTIDFGSTLSDYSNDQSVQEAWNAVQENVS